MRKTLKAWWFFTKLTFYLAAFWASLILAGYGLAKGWPEVAKPSIAAFVLATVYGFVMLCHQCGYRAISLLKKFTIRVLEPAASRGLG